MKTIKNLERLERLHFLIENEISGSPKDIANRLHISERIVYHLLEELRDYNALIYFDRSRKTYYYCNEFQLRIAVSVSVCSNSEVTQIFGKQALVS